MRAYSDILTLNGINAVDQFVLQMTYDPTAPTGEEYLAHYDMVLGKFVNAISGNSDHVTDSANYLSGGTGIGHFVDSAYTSEDDILGYYGYDAVNNTVWAVLGFVQRQRRRSNS